jgi:hypothetical protein
MVPSGRAIWPRVAVTPFGVLPGSDPAGVGGQYDAQDPVHVVCPVVSAAKA